VILGNAVQIARSIGPAKQNGIEESAMKRISAAKPAITTISVKRPSKRKRINLANL